MAALAGKKYLHENPGALIRACGWGREDRGSRIVDEDRKDGDEDRSGRKGGSSLAH